MGVTVLLDVEASVSVPASLPTSPIAPAGLEPATSLPQNPIVTSGFGESIQGPTSGRSVHWSYGATLWLSCRSL